MSATPAAGDPEVTVLATIQKMPDLEIHVCELRFPLPWNITAVELRDFVPSTGEYGAGYWMTVDAAWQLADLLTRERGLLS